MPRWPTRSPLGPPAAALLVAGLSVGCADSSVTHDLVVRDVRVVDVEAGTVATGWTLAVDDTLLTFVGADPDGRHEGRIEVEGAGRYAIPGLWDMHVHIEGEELVEDNLLLFPVYLAYGVTTVRDMASDLGEQVLAWRDEIEAGSLLGPRIYTAGRKIEGVNSVWRGDLEVADEAEMRSMMDRLDAYGVDFVKVTENTLEADLFLATVREARGRGYLVSGHVPHGATVEEAARAGLSSIEHASHLVRMGHADEAGVAASVRRGETSRGEAQARYDEGFSQERATTGYRKLAALGTFVTPTLVGSHRTAYLDETDHGSDEFQRYLTDAFMAPYGPRAARALAASPDEKAARKERFARVAAQVPLLLEAGVTILGGSDSAPIAIYVYPGRGLHDELGLFQQAGLSPAEALRTVTVDAARFLGQEGAAGTLAEGRFADVVLLRDNPLDDVSATLSIEAVVSRGRLFDRVALDGILERAAARVAGLNEERAEIPRP